MTTLHRTQDVRVSAGTTFRTAHRARPASLLSWACRGLVCGVLLGVLIATGTSPSTAVVLGLGCVTLAWLLLSFASERPDEA